MKIFNETEPWLSKVNFVDENNVVLGYDMNQLCCEDANWFISDTPNTPDYTILQDSDRDLNQDFDVSDWCFDPAYFKSIDNCSGYSESNFAIFKIVKKNTLHDPNRSSDDEKYIHLYNVHNGYYSHGFAFMNDTNKITEGRL
jgi:hypothetical protein